MIYGKSIFKLGEKRMFNLINGIGLLSYPFGRKI